QVDLPGAVLERRLHGHGIEPAGGQVQHEAAEDVDATDLLLDHEGAGGRPEVVGLDDEGAKAGILGGPRDLEVVADAAIQVGRRVDVDVDGVLQELEVGTHPAPHAFTPAGSGSARVSSPSCRDSRTSPSPSPR